MSMLNLGPRNEEEYAEENARQYREILELRAERDNLRDEKRELTAELRAAESRHEVLVAERDLVLEALAETKHERDIEASMREEVNRCGARLSERLWQLEKTLAENVPGSVAADAIRVLAILGVMSTETFQSRGETYKSCPHLARYLQEARDRANKSSTESTEES